MMLLLLNKAMFLSNTKKKKKKPTKRFPTNDRTWCEIMPVGMGEKQSGCMDEKSLCKVTP